MSGLLFDSHPAASHLYRPYSQMQKYPFRHDIFMIFSAPISVFFSTVIFLPYVKKK